MQAGLEWTAQVRRGVLEFCVLGLIRQRPAYGYELISRLARWESLSINEGTLYPLLRRLQKDGMVESTWQESDAGPVRKYYRLTPLGTERLQRMDREWNEVVRSVAEILAERG